MSHLPWTPYNISLIYPGLPIISHPSMRASFDDWIELPKVRVFIVDGCI